MPVLERFLGPGKGPAAPLSDLSALQGRGGEPGQGAGLNHGDHAIDIYGLWVRQCLHGDPAQESKYEDAGCFRIDARAELAAVYAALNQGGETIPESVALAE